MVQPEEERMNEELWMAVSSSKAEMVRQLLIHGADVNYQDHELKRSLLYRAAGFAGDDQICKIMLDWPGILVNNVTTQGGTPLYIAAQQGHSEIVKLFLQDPRVDVTLPSKSKATPFLISSENGHIEVVKLFMKDPRIDINAPDSDGHSPLLMAVCNGHTEIVKLLLDDPRIEPNKKNNTGQSPLFMAAKHDRVEIAQILLDNNIVNTVLDEEPLCNPIWIAMENGRMDVLKNLFASWRINASVKWDQNTFKGSALHGKPQIVQLIRSYVENPALIRRQLRNELKLSLTDSCYVFMYFVLLCDGYFTVKKESKDSKMKIFYEIGMMLPMDLQMVLCNQLYDNGRSYISTNLVENTLATFIQKKII